MATRRALEEWLSLDSSTSEKVRLIVFEIISIKQLIHKTADASNASAVCANCGGACCTAGKYHFSAIDLLPYFTYSKPLFSPDYDNGSCPYLSDFRCAMLPEFRPYTCVTFVCESIENNLSEDDKAGLKFNTERLKTAYSEIENIFGRRLSGGLLHYAELLGNSRNGIFTSKH